MRQAVVGVGMLSSEAKARSLWIYVCDILRRQLLIAPKIAELPNGEPLRITHSASHIRSRSRVVLAEIHLWQCRFRPDPGAEFPWRLYHMACGKMIELRVDPSELRLNEYFFHL